MHQACMVNVTTVVKIGLDNRSKVRLHFIKDTDKSKCPACGNLINCKSGYALNSTKYLRQHTVDLKECSSLSHQPALEAGITHPDAPFSLAIRKRQVKRKLRSVKLYVFTL